MTREKNVAADLVGAEPMVGAGGREQVADVDRRRDHKAR